LTAPRLRDPRLWAGVLLVAVSAVVGGRVLASADDTTRVWAASRDLPAGSVVTDADVVATAVRFEGAATRESYAAADVPVDGQRLIARLRAGELVATAALTSGERSDPELPLGVAASDLPADLASGDQVDVWAVAADGRSDAVARVLRGVRVVEVGRPDVAGSGADRQVLIAVGGEDDIAAALAALADARPVLVRVDG
jgi:hypothetical protein